MVFFQLIRIKEWAKNLFLFMPIFFSGQLFESNKIVDLLIGFFAFSFVASCIYIINDYRDIEDDRKHPVKCKRPLAAGTVKKSTGIIIAILLFIAGFGLSVLADHRLKFSFVL